MLKQRVITAIIFAAIVATLILLLPPRGLAVVFAALVLAAAYEWAALSGLESVAAKGLYVMALGALLAVSAWFLLPLPNIDVYGLDALLRLTVGVWVLAAVAIVLYPRASRFWGMQAGIAYMGFVVLAPPWVALVYLRTLPGGELLVLYAIGLIAMADLGAYFSGRAFGGPRLMPRVSPAKTWSGCAGGLLASVLFALAVGMAAGLSGTKLGQWLLLGGVTAAVSVVGDLLESMVKRHAGLKDSGSLLPGHGGLLDRLDSLSAGMPIFALGLLHCGIFW